MIASETSALEAASARSWISTMRMLSTDSGGAPVPAACGQAVSRAVHTDDQGSARLLSLARQWSICLQPLSPALSRQGQLANCRRERTTKGSEA